MSLFMVFFSFNFFYNSYTCSESNRNERCLSCALADNRILLKVDNYDWYCVC